MGKNKEMSGVFWVNRKGRPNHPDFRGSVMIKGVDYPIAGWRKGYTDKKTGEKAEYISLQVEDPEEAEARRNSYSKETPAARSREEDDELPF